ncbi:hypothetical protein E2C01_029992 [Portunus trituberculatus]|uniref:Uncharacterized protein n=1 Tax=Portunus trituberculatus TaxID=210409 RepID=A0A5B7EPB2_PORTR|nr:hypothetical protein [Portunus trituberculatus]
MISYERKITRICLEENVELLHGYHSCWGTGARESPGESGERDWAVRRESRVREGLRPMRGAYEVLGGATASALQPPVTRQHRQ